VEEEFAKFNFPIEDKSENIIQVIGVGGGGGNAVQHMWEEGVKNVEFMAVNTDSQVLASNLIPNKILLGTEGLGTGGNPEKGEKIAEEYIDEIKSIFNPETKMVFITSGMGGGTGTGVSPVIARVAKEMGILTIGVVTLPFKMEGKKRISVALKGMEKLRGCVDSLIVINNEHLRMSNLFTDMTWEEGMKKADEVLTIVTKTIAEIITVRGYVNRDFNDVCAVMRDSGTAVVSVAKASGEKRLFKAMQEALNYPLLPSVEKKQVKRLLYIVYNGEKNPARIQELTDINRFMEGFSEDIEVLWGHYPDETLDDEIKVSIIATGFDDRTVSTAEKKDEHLHLGKLYEEYYGRLGSADTNTITITNNVPQQPKVEECAGEESSCSAEEFDMTEEDKDAEPEQKGSVWSNMVKMMTVFMSE